MTMLEKQIATAHKNLEKAEKALERAEKKLAKVTPEAEKHGVAIPLEQWYILRDSGAEISKETNWAHFEYFSACERIKDELRRLNTCERKLSKLEALQSEREIENENEKAIIDDVSIQAIEQFLDNWEVSAAKYFIKLFNGDTERAKREAKRERGRKKIFIIYRVNGLIGKIVDAGSLYMGKDGNINGVIIGEKRHCHCQTILAGGHNVQCLHFRFLVS